MTSSVSRVAASLVPIFVLALALQAVHVHAVYFSVTNKCAHPVWINIENNHGVQSLKDARVTKLLNGQSYKYNIPPTGWAGRLWPKTGCDSTGYNCEFGDATPPCPAKGCHPPADTKAEFFFGTGTMESYYDISLVDGYTLPMKIAPVGNVGGSCTTTTCAMSLDDCPTSQKVGLLGMQLGDHRVKVNGKVVGCLAPCKVWNYPSPYGLQKDERVYPGLYLCCPTPPVEPDQCRRGW